MGHTSAIDPDLRVINWNVQHTLTRADARLALLEDLEHRLGRWDVLCAQEVMPAMFEQLVSAFEGEAAYFFDEPGEREAGARSAAMILARPPWSLVDAEALHDAPSPLRPATAVVTVGGHRRAAVASGALPPASMPRWGVGAKVDQAQAFRKWIESQESLPVIMGLDANGPLADTVDGVTFHDESERVIFGFAEAPLRDSYRALLTDDELQRLRRLRPDGPLAVTHMAGGRAPRRYDYILTKGCEVLNAGYIIGDAFAAGSDHALAYAHVRLSV